MSYGSWPRSYEGEGGQIILNQVSRALGSTALGRFFHISVNWIRDITKEKGKPPLKQTAAEMTSLRSKCRHRTFPKDSKEVDAPRGIPGLRPALHLETASSGM